MSPGPSGTRGTSPRQPRCPRLLQGGSEQEPLDGDPVKGSTGSYGFSLALARGYGAVRHSESEQAIVKADRRKRSGCAHADIGTERTPCAGSHPSPARYRHEDERSGLGKWFAAVISRVLRTARNPTGGQVSNDQSFPVAGFVVQFSPRIRIILRLPMFTYLRK